MKKTISLAILCFVAYNTIAQQAFPGYRSGNYTGVNGVFFNPANIADSRYRWSFNLFSINAGVGNDKASFKLKDITSGSNDLEDNFTNGSGNSNGSVNVDFFGPSLMFNLNKKSAIAITTRARVMANLKDIDGNLLQSISDSADETYPYIFSSGANSRIISNGWSEIGLSYARELSNKGAHYFKGGITLKYLSGVGNNYVQLDQLKGTINDDPLLDNYLQNASGTINIGNGGARIDDIKASNVFNSGQSGIGADIGFVYEYRPDYSATNGTDYQRNLNKYKYKVSVSLLDVGKIKYVTNPASTGGYTINISGAERFYLSELEDKNADEIKAVLNSHPDLFTPTAAASATSYKVSLPTTLQVEMDYHLHRGFFASLGGQFDLVKKSSFYNPNQYNSITLTPRYEGKAFGFYLPVNYNQLTKFNVGLSLRGGPFFIGSGSIITAIAKSKQADIHMGLRFGVLHKNKKQKETPVVEVAPPPPPPPAPVDTDGDGIFDDVDKCVTVPGIAKYEGCPIPDTDGDGVNDEVDKCITVAGLAKYDGCPIPDTDKDGVNDEEDKCVTIPGLAKYNGCPIPDTDGDGINDEEDKCPAVPGVALNFGCPEIKADVIKKVQFAASNLFFATGKSVILPRSFAGLNTLANILASDPTLKLSLEGHTDDVGTEENNQKLSEDRANAAKAYFVKKGIDESRISTAGYGETKPIADNKTAAGKTKNRRVEFKVTNY